MMIEYSIDSFLDQHPNKPVVVVQGLGFVGAVMSLVVANADEEQYAVIGIDLPERKAVIDGLNSGEFPIKSSDPKVFEYHEKSRKKGNFFATHDKGAYSKADIVIVDINLDVKKRSGDDRLLESYSVSMDGFKAAMRDIARNCKPDVLVLIETTVPPGTSKKIITPIFKEEYDKRNLNYLFKIGHSYERVMPGPGYIDSIKNFYRVYSGIDEASANAVERFLNTIISTDQYPLTRLANTNASEMSKVLENSFRAMNIAFIQEWTEFAEAAGVDLYEVVNAIRMRPTHKNIMRPGLGVGGYCLTKDPLLASWASQELFDSISLAQSEKAVMINDQMPLHTFERIMKRFNNDLKGKKFLMLGISYLQNVGDTRYTPVELLFEKLISAGADVQLHDPFVSHWDEKDLRVDSGEVPSGDYDAIILGTPHDVYLSGGMLSSLLDKSQNSIVVDPHGVVSSELKQRFQSIEFNTIGKGQ